jgi:transcriptional regulator with XRE-family HTH domain
VSDKLSTNIAANLKRLRLARQISQQRLSDLSGVPRPTLAHLESGAANPTLAVVLKVSEALRVRLEELWQQPEPIILHTRGDELPTRSRAGGKFLRLLGEASSSLGFERIELAPSGRVSVKAASPGNRHHLFCETGEVTIVAGGERCALGAGEGAAIGSDIGYKAHNGARAVAVLFRVVAPVHHRG